MGSYDSHWWGLAPTGCRSDERLHINHTAESNPILFRELSGLARPTCPFAIQQKYAALVESRRPVNSALSLKFSITGSL